MAPFRSTVRRTLWYRRATALALDGPPCSAGLSTEGAQGSLSRQLLPYEWPWPKGPPMIEVRALLG